MEQDHITEQLSERLSTLEYAIRQSMSVREDQDEAADLQHKNDAECCGIAVEAAMSKGDLLNAVQTLLRATQKKQRGAVENKR